MPISSRLALAAAAAIAICLLTAASAHAKLPPECVNRFEGKIDGHVSAIGDAMNKSGRLADVGNNLLRVRGEAFRYIKGDWANDCANAAPANRERMNKYVTAKLAPALTTLARGFIGVCIKHGARNGSISERRPWRVLPAMAKWLSSPLRLAI